MNTQLLLRVRSAILARPEAFDMVEWVSLKGEHEKIFGQPCGTVCCIGGWAAVLSGVSASVLDGMQQESAYKDVIYVIARALLGLTAEQANRLFYVEDWPEPYKSHYLSTDKQDAVAKAVIAARRIDAFICEVDGRLPLNTAEESKAVTPARFY